MSELRCNSKMHGILIPEEKLLEIKCNSRFCGAQRGIIILHRFNIETGDLVKTIQLRDPVKKGTKE